MNMTHHPIPVEVMKAVERFTALVTVPVLYDDPKILDQVGTGTLFGADNRLFLVTAAHLFEKADPARFSIPSLNTTEVHTLGKYNLLRAKDELIDIAVLELLEPATIERARASWRVLALENTAPASPEGVFALCGYPSERAKRIGGLIGGSLITSYTVRLPKPPDHAEQPVHLNLDMFFHYDKEAVDTEGRTVATPDLGGCSGASVWEYREPPNMTFWTPEQCLKIVGVQSAFRKGDYFRAKSWAAVLEIMRQADASLAGVVEAFKAQIR
jgi:hypothetical protein